MQTKIQLCEIALRWPLANPVTGQVYNPYENTNQFCDWLSERTTGLGTVWFDAAVYLTSTQPRPDIN